MIPNWSFYFLDISEELVLFGDRREEGIQSQSANSYIKLISFIEL